MRTAALIDWFEWFAAFEWLMHESHSLLAAKWSCEHNPVWLPPITGLTRHTKHIICCKHCLQRSAYNPSIIIILCQCTACLSEAHRHLLQSPFHSGSRPAAPYLKTGPPALSIVGALGFGDTLLKVATGQGRLQSEPETTYPLNKCSVQRLVHLDHDKVSELHQESSEECSLSGKHLLWQVHNCKHKHIHSASMHMYDPDIMHTLYTKLQGLWH